MKEREREKENEREWKRERERKRQTERERKRERERERERERAIDSQTEVGLEEWAEISSEGHFLQKVIESISNVIRTSVNDSMIIVQLVIKKRGKHLMN